jgi:hypothetical protein
VKYLDGYLNWRARKWQGVTNIGEYRSLDPESKLFITPAGKPFSFSRRESGNSTNLQAHRDERLLQAFN